MSRRDADERAALSPTQVKAIVVMILCAIAIAASILVGWVLPGKLGLFEAKDNYDPDAYPVDTTLGAVLAEDSGDSDYLTTTLFVGDQYTLSMKEDSRITLNQYAAQSGMQISDFMGTSFVYFSGDSSAYTISQAVAKLKPRRVIVTLGSNDADGTVSLDDFIQDYKQALQSIASAYPYCDVIANSIPPVTQSSEDAANRQTYIDQFNQAIAAACEDMGDYKFLNSAEALKNEKGYAEESYFDGDGFSRAGINALITYVTEHAWNTEDRRPDTDDIPQRTEQASASQDTPEATPTATPSKLTASYSVEEGKGTLTGNGQTGATSIEVEVEPDSRQTVSVTAIAAEGYTFYKWSDGQTSETRYDIVTQDISVVAMFNDARVELTLDKGDTTLESGETLTINASVKLGNKDYDASNVQWSVNDELEQNGASYTFDYEDAGTYTVKAGIEINGTFKLAEITVTVEEEEDPTSITITATDNITVGQSTTLVATVENGSGETTWTCDETSWEATGDQVQFTPMEEGEYTLRATNNGVRAKFYLTVLAKPEPTATPTPTPSPTPEPTAEAADSTASE